MSPVSGSEVTWLEMRRRWGTYFSACWQIFAACSVCISLYKVGRVVMTVTHSKFGSVRRQRVRWAESAQRIEMILEHLSAAAGCGALSYRLLKMTVVLHQHFLCYCNHSHAGGGDSVIVTSQRNRSCLQAHFLKRFSEDWAFQFKKWLVLKILCV